MAIKKNHADSLLDQNLKIIEALVRHGADPRLVPDYSVLGLGAFGEKRSALAVARAEAEEYRGYYKSETDPGWRAKKRKRWQHRKNIVTLLESQ